MRLFKNQRLLVVFVATFVFPVKFDLSTKSFQLLTTLITLTDFTDTTTCLLFPFDVIYGNSNQKKKHVYMCG